MRPLPPLTTKDDGSIQWELPNSYKIFQTAIPPYSPTSTSPKRKKKNYKKKKKGKRKKSQPPGLLNL